MTSLRVSRQPSGEPEVFCSLQGEGITVGVPATFVRLATCNLACDWCDTSYTWDWAAHDYESGVMMLTADEVLRRVLALGCRRVVITGGEPLMQGKQLVPLARSLVDRGCTIEVETNGTLSPGRELAGAVSQWNVSPKLANSGVERRRRLVSAPIEAFAKLENAYFKFVVAEPGDIDEVVELVESHGVPSSRVLLMPEGTTAETLGRRAAWVAQLCIDKGFRFSTRLHILLWGDARGR